MSKSCNSLILLFLVTIFSCGTVDRVDHGINTKANNQYRKSAKEFNGRLNESDYKAYRQELETELRTNVPADKAIVIKYAQSAPNCLFLGQGKKGFGGSMELVIKHLGGIGEKNNAAVFFIYNENSFHKDLYENNENYTVDSGFFAEKIFTERENCSGFLVLKPNGEIFKNYGEDNTSDVEEILQAK